MSRCADPVEGFAALKLEGLIGCRSISLVFFEYEDDDEIDSSQWADAPPSDFFGGINKLQIDVDSARRNEAQRGAWHDQ